MFSGSFVRFIYFSLCYFLSFSSAFAQWSTSPDSALLIGVGDYTHIISDNKGGAFVLFDGDDWVRLQKVEKYGYVQWINITPQGGIAVGGNTSPNCGQGIACDFPLVLDNAGGVYVAFHDFCYITPEITAAVARVQHVDSLGNLLWGPDGMVVSTHTVYESFWGGIAGDGSGGIIALYNERDSLYGPTKLYGQHFDGQGNRLWGNEGILLKEPGGFSYVVGDGYGGAVFTYGFFIQRINYLGQKMYGENGIEIPTGGVEIKVDHENDYIYVHGGNYIGGNQNRLAVQKLALSDGSLHWDSLGVTIDTFSVNSGVYDFNIDLQGNIWIAWYYFENGEAFIQRVSPSGNKLFSLPGIPPSLFPSQKGGLKLQPSQNSSMIVIWSDDRNGSSNFYGQRIDGNGNYLWQDDSRISNIPGGANTTTDNNYGVILSWWRLSNFGIYVHQVSINGNLGEVLTTLNSVDNEKLPFNFKLFQNYPNPFNTGTVIKFQLWAFSDIDLEVYNCLSQKVKNLVSEKLLPGIYRIEWNGIDETSQQVSSGVYYYILKVGDYSQTGKMILLR